MERGVTLRQGLPKMVLESPPLEVFKDQLDVTLSALGLV